MKKIVIITDHPENCSELLKILSSLFPECEISIVSRRGIGDDRDPGDMTENHFNHGFGEIPMYTTRSSKTHQLTLTQV